MFSQINKFSDIYEITKKFNTKQKGDFFEIITKYIFILHPNYCNITKNIWLYEDIPIKYAKKFNLPTQDKGIDLLLENNDGEFFAIQSKYRSNIFASVTWGELSTFAGQLFVGNFKNAIYVTNTYDIDKEINKCNKISCVCGDFFNDDNLDKHFFDNIRCYLQKKEIIHVKRKPYDYQLDAINDTIEYFKENDRGYLSMACGTGKTFTTCEIDNKMENKITLVLVPSLYLLSQLYKEWSLEHANNKNIKFILVGSDIDTKEPFLSTDTKNIKKKIKEYKQSKIIIISTYQSCDKLSSLKEADLIIFDEAHKTVSDGLFTFALHNDNIKAKKRLFVTATPKIYDKKIDTNSDDDAECIICMGNKNIYGDCIYTYQIGQAIDDNRLTPYEIHLMYITDKQIKQYQNKLVNIDNITYNFHYIATMMMIKQLFKEKEINHLLTYHSSIKNCKDFESLLDENLEDVYTDQIDGDMSSRKKSQLIVDFKNSSKSILTSARVLNEGVNIVEVDSVCFVESRKSSIDIIQCVGRALRLYEGKNIAKIIIPILEEDVEISKFSDLIRTIRNLSEYDYNVKEMIMNKNKDVRKLIKVGVYKSNDNANMINNIELESLIGKINTCIIDRIYSWDQTYEDVCKYYDINKKRANSKSEDLDEKRLGHWIEHQKYNYKQNKEAMKDLDKKNKWEELNEKYKKYLSDRDKIWYTTYYQLYQFYDNYKRKPSKNSKDPEEKRLVLWIAYQKAHYKQNKNSMKDIDKRNKWEELNEIYKEYLLNIDEAWYKSYDELSKYLDIKKKTPNAESIDPTEKRLGIWMMTQKSNYIKKINNMQDEVKQTKWKELYEKYTEYLIRPDTDELWYKSYNSVYLFFNKKNKKPNAKSKDLEEKQLGRWMNHQKYNYDKNCKSMKDEQKKNLWKELTEKYKKYLPKNKKPIKIKKSESNKKYDTSDSDFSGSDSDFLL